MMKTTRRKLLFLAAMVGLVGSTSFGQITTPPVIDGDGADAVWATQTAMDLLRDNGSPGVTDAADFSGSVKALWDATTLYVLVEVMDDSLNIETPEAWLRDHYTVYFDLSDLKTAAYVEDKDATLDSVQFNVEKPWSEPQGFNWEGDTLEQGVDFVETIRTDGYTVEYAFPLDRIGVTLSDQQVLGFDVKIGDNDGDGRDGMYSLYQAADEGWRNPSYLGTAKLETDGSISKVMHSPVIDGADDYTWNVAKEYQLEVENDITGITDAADFSGSFKVMHDLDNVYVLLDVKDDSLNIETPESWLRDHYTIYFDVSNLKNTSYVEDKDATLDSIQFNVEKPWSEPQGWSWEGDTLEQGVDFVEVIGEDGYTVEYAFPFHRLGVTMEEGANIGFDVKIGDNDGDGRDATLSWHQVADESWRNPAYMGNLVLEPVFVDLGTTSKGDAMIEIDGLADGDWVNAVAMPLERENDITGITDAADFSGVAKALWDKDNFYVLLEVKDDSLNIETPESWLRDHYTIYFDLDNLKTDAYVESSVEPLDSIQFNVEKPWSEPQGFNWEGDTLVQGVDFVEVIGEDGYSVEFAFPFHRLGVDLSAYSGEMIGFDVKIGDNDGEGRDATLSWNQLADESWRNPSYMGEVTLMANGTVDGTPEVVAVTADVTYNVDMTGMIAEGIFDAAVDFVDLAGTMNNWGDPEGSVATDDDADGIYTVVSAGLELGDIEFKFRVNGAWDPISEFPGGGNRMYTVVEGENIVNVVFNDGDYTPWIVEGVEIDRAALIHVYPNPAASIVNLQNVADISTIELVNLLGQVTYKQLNSGNSSVVMSIEDQASGVYMIRFTGEANEISYKKLIIE